MYIQSKKKVCTPRCMYTFFWYILIFLEIFRFLEKGKKSNILFDII